MGVLFGEQAVPWGELNRGPILCISGGLMRRKLAAATVIAIAAIALFSYHYWLLSDFEAKSLSPTPTATPCPTPTIPPSTPTVGEPKVTVSFIEWDPHNSSYPTQIVILYPNNETYTAGWWPELQVGVSSNNWLINGVFYTADWQEGYQPIWYYNLGARQNALFARVTLTGVPDGTHTIVVHANLHDGSHIQSSVTFSVNSSAKP